jgi:thiol-disulfide isomerase/thioredoxin
MFGTRSAIVGTLLSPLLLAPALALELGDPAPPLQVKEWVKGGPIDLNKGKGKNVYVVEFWATWCTPCRQSIPHLAELQKKYKNKGVVVVGVSSTDQDVATVKKFVQSQGATMDYAVAYEERGKAATDKAYMGGFHRSGIPHAFVIDKKGKIVWEGHPSGGLDAAVEAVLAGNYTVQSLAGAGQKPGRVAGGKPSPHEKLIADYFALVSKPRKAAAAEKLGAKVFKALADDPNALNSFAYRILTDEAVQTRDLELALRAAKAANNLKGGQDDVILDTYALALWENGQREEAVKHEQKAVELASTAKEKARFQQRLAEYERKLRDEK